MIKNTVFRFGDLVNEKYSTVEASMTSIHCIVYAFYDAIEANE